jgi:hypothetical protein
MGILTDDMARLRNEIEALRQGRKTLLKEMVRGAKAMKSAVAKMQAGFRQSQGRMSRETRANRLRFLHDLNTGVARMQTGFRQAHAQMAHETKGERLAFLSNLKTAVFMMQTGFHQARMHQAKRGRAGRRQFVSRLQEVVGGLRQEFAADLAGARRAFFGFSEPKARAEAPRRAREATPPTERPMAEGPPQGKGEKEGAPGGKK